jgi:hypothetical protein
MTFAWAGFSGDGKPVFGDIQDEVTAHNAQADHSDFTLLLSHLTTPD